MSRSQKAPSLGSGGEGVGHVSAGVKGRGPLHLQGTENPTAIDLSKGGSLLLAHETEVLGRPQLQARLDPWTSAVMSEMHPFPSLCPPSLFRLVLRQAVHMWWRGVCQAPKTRVCQVSHP